MAALPSDEAQATVVRLHTKRFLGDPLTLFRPLLHAIAVIALGDNALCPQTEAALVQLEQRGYHLTAAAHAIWGGQRDPAVLTMGLRETDIVLVQRVLALLAVEALWAGQGTSTALTDGLGPNTRLVEFVLFELVECGAIQENQPYPSLLQIVMVQTQGDDQAHTEVIAILNQLAHKGFRPDAAYRLNKLANVWYARGQCLRAVPVYELAVRVAIHVLGPEHTTTRTIRANWRACLIDAYLGSLSAAASEPSREVLAPARKVAEAAMGFARAGRRGLALAIEARAQRAAAIRGQTWQQSSQKLRVLIAQLGYELVVQGAILVFGSEHTTTRTIRANWRPCLIDAYLGPVHSTGSISSTGVLAQARTAVEAALAKPMADRRRLALAIEARAQWAVIRGGAWRQCAQELRALITQLGVEQGDLDPLV